MKTRFTCYLSIFLTALWLLTGFAQKQKGQNVYLAGELVTISFEKQPYSTKAVLIVSHSYGKTVLSPLADSEKLTFEIPSFISEKTGTITAVLQDGNTATSKRYYTIISNTKTKTHIENYLGPRTVLAEPTHFNMMVSVPTDRYDNPKKDSTLVTLKNQYQNEVTVDSLRTSGFVAWKRIYSKEKKGKMLSYTKCELTTSQAIETEIQANIATRFELSHSVNHNYADGNQITTIRTSEIKDKYGNLVNDGTFVNFIVTTKEETILRYYGATIAGVATTKILHPDHPDRFRIKAYVAGIAESESHSITYNKIETDIPYHILNYQRLITVGPIKSFMGQIVPDGIEVKTTIYRDGKVVGVIRKPTLKGMVQFEMNPNFYPENRYSIEITTLGNTISVPEIKYED